MGDFSRLADRLVLRAAMTAFAKTKLTVSVMPAVSQPGMPPYSMRGIWTVRPIDVHMEGDSIMSSEVRTLGIRLSEFAVPIVQGDMITVDGTLYLVDDKDDDGQTGTTLTLKEMR